MPAKKRTRRPGRPRASQLPRAADEGRESLDFYLQEISRIVRTTPALLIVDAISSLSSIDLKTDAWGCDLVLSASQKGWMAPPGLAPSMR